MRLESAAVGPLEIVGVVGIAALVVVIVMLAVVLLRLSPSRRGAEPAEPAEPAERDDGAGERREGARRRGAAAASGADAADGAATATATDGTGRAGGAGGAGGALSTVGRTEDAEVDVRPANPTIDRAAGGPVARSAAPLSHDVVAPFVDVARRDQSLLNRQLELLDSLERSEEDPEVLMNLFQLDNLATRMRRNAESLLVLADAEPGRRVRSTMPLSDVLRTASSQIEHYDRVVLDLVEDPVVLGHHVLPIAHLLAELLENATNYSDPTSVVEITDRVADGALAVTVLDSGLGMSDAEMADARRKVDGTTTTSEVGLQRLGLYVVGQLAEKVGATVSFRAREGAAGTEVTVRLPASVFAPEPVAVTTDRATTDPAPAPVTVAAPTSAAQSGTVTPASLIGVPLALAAAMQASAASISSSPGDAPGMPTGFGVSPADPQAVAAAALPPLPTRTVEGAEAAEPKPAPTPTFTPEPIPKPATATATEPESEPTRPGPVRRTVRRPGRSGAVTAPPPPSTAQVSLPMRPRTGATPVAAPTAPTPPSSAHWSSMFSRFRVSADVDDAVSAAPQDRHSLLDDYVLAVTASDPGSGSASSLPSAELFGTAGRPVLGTPVSPAAGRALPSGPVTARGTGTVASDATATTDAPEPAGSLGGPIEQALLFDTAHLSERLAWMRAVEAALEHDAAAAAAAAYQPPSELIGAPDDLATRTPSEAAPEGSAHQGPSDGTAGGASGDAEPSLGEPGQTAVSQDAHSIRARLTAFQSASTRGRADAAEGFARRPPANGVDHR